jgi:hypothetical protein
VLQEMRGYRLPLTLKIPHENPRVPDRINALNRLLLDEDKRARLMIDQSCTELIADLEEVKRDKKGGILKITNKKDPYFRRTHTSDAVGYLAAFEEPVRPPSDAQSRSVPPPVRYGRAR